MNIVEFSNKYDFYHYQDYIISEWITLEKNPELDDIFGSLIGSKYRYEKYNCNNMMYHIDIDSFGDYFLVDQVLFDTLLFFQNYLREKEIDSIFCINIVKNHKEQYTENIIDISKFSELVENYIIQRINIYPIKWK